MPSTMIGEPRPGCLCDKPALAFNRLKTPNTTSPLRFQSNGWPANQTTFPNHKSRRLPMGLASSISTISHFSVGFTSLPPDKSRLPCATPVRRTPRPWRLFSRVNQRRSFDLISPNSAQIALIWDLWHPSALTSKRQGVNSDDVGFSGKFSLLRGLG